MKIFKNWYFEDWFLVTFISIIFVGLFVMTALIFRIKMKEAATPTIQAETPTIQIEAPISAPCIAKAITAPSTYQIVIVCDDGSIHKKYAGQYWQEVSKKWSEGY